MSTVLPSRLSVVVDQLPPNLRETITYLFTTRLWPASKCDEMLECLLRYAQVEQLALNKRDQCATIFIPNLLRSHREDRHWRTTCSYQTAHTFIRLLCALEILRKQQSGCGQETTYVLPLDPQYHFQVTPTILEAVEQLCDQKYAKNPKMRKKAYEIRDRLLLMAPMIPCNIPTKLQGLPLALQRRIQQCVRTLVDSLHLSPLTTATLAQKITEICTNAFYQETLLGASEDSSSGRSTGEVVSTRMESTRYSALVDSISDVQARESTRYGVLVDSITLSEQRDEHDEHERQHESTKGDKNLPYTAPSSIDSVFRQNDSFQKEFELESPVDEPWIGSEEELSQEAIGYLALLDGPDYATPEYLNTHAGKKALGGYKNKIRRSPHLARLAAINTLLQGTFYDLTKQKKPLVSAGKWFHSSFNRYADAMCPMEITGEILDWAKSPYTLKEIALVIPLERKRQETQWWPSERLHYPFSSCVTQYHHLPDPQRSLPEENRDGSSLAGTQMKTDGLLRLSAHQGMSASEAEHVATEIRQEASWYLYDIRVRASQEGENTSVVEAYIVDSIFPVTYRTRQEWWIHHQEQQRYLQSEQQRGEIYAACP